MASPLLFLSYIYVLLCHPWFLCLGGILNILAWESLCFILFMFLSKEWWPDMLSRRLVILYKRWLMLILVMISVVLTVLFVFDTQYKYIYRQWLYYVYIYITTDMLLQSTSYVHHVQDGSNQQVQPLSFQASAFWTSGSNWVTKGCAS